MTRIMSPDKAPSTLTIGVILSHLGYNFRLIFVHLGFGFVEED